MSHGRQGSGSLSRSSSSSGVGPLLALQSSRQQPRQPQQHNQRQVLPSSCRLRRSASSSTATTELPPILPNPPIPPAPIELRRPKGPLMSLLDDQSMQSQQERIERAESLFQASKRQAADPRWYGPGRIERDFRPRHAMLTLHLWLVHKRLLADQYDKNAALAVDEELFCCFWDNTSNRLRQSGVHELAVNKMLKQVQQYTFMHLTHYDHTYTDYLDRPYDRLQELRKLVWMHIFVRQPSMEKAYDHLDRIAWYIDANYRNIMHEWPDEYYRESRVKWVDLPDFTNLKDAEGVVLPEAPVHPDDVAPAPWIVNVTSRGVPYYWNTETRESSWIKPDLPDMADCKKLFDDKNQKAQ